MEHLGEDLDIVLFPEGEEGAEFRTKAPPHHKNVYQADHGDALFTKANIVSITHGTMAPGDDPATLLIFEFRFISMQPSRRFTTCNITVTFEDSDKVVDYCPVVHHIAPDGSFALHKTKAVRNVNLNLSAGLRAGFGGLASAETGIAWKMDEAKDIENWTRLSGTRREVGSSGKDDAAVWSAAENAAAKSGIPSFLRTAVLLRRAADAPFNILFEIRAKADFNIADAVSRSLLGKKKVERLVPVKIDPEQTKVPTADPRVVDLNNLGKLKLGRFADVTLITILKS
ncbi:hypothetical protein SLS63_013161 [Diaporthe eres]|uniref:Uncharacterized protein n=1 Tax=Diaporthe eres TaxID=83184 RepID=A0ABR1NPD2_DIAER